MLVEGETTWDGRGDGDLRGGVCVVAVEEVGARALRLPSTLPPPMTLRDMFSKEEKLHENFFDPRIRYDIRKMPSSLQCWRANPPLRTLGA